jgi:hypothetical protein
MDTIILKKKGKGKQRIAYSISIRVVLTLFSIITASAFFRPVVSDYYSKGVFESDKEKLLRASRITNESARYHYLMGLLEYSSRDRSETERAIGHYLASLKNNPSDSQVWLAIANAYRDTGNMKDADYAMTKALYYDKEVPNVIWEAGRFFLSQNKQKEALQALRRYISLVPGEQGNVYALCYMMKLNPLSILNDLIPADYSFYRHYLAFLIANRLLDESTEVWKRIKAYNPDRSEYLKYCDFLIASGAMSDARAVWDDFVKRFYDPKKNQVAGLLWNGDFEVPIENGGFDWKVGVADGVRVYRDKDIKWTGFASLSVNFSGNTNPAISVVQQIVPVDPGHKYTLSGHVRTEGITTQNGIVLEVSGYLCDPFTKKSEPVTGTTLWKPIDLEFTVPLKCKAVIIAVKRERSDKFDNKISGDAWIDSLVMTHTKTK